MGCPKCENTGKRGRIALLEYLRPDEGFAELVLKRSSSEVLKRHGIDHCGMITLRADGLDKAMRGLVTLEDALAASTADYVD